MSKHNADDPVVFLRASDYYGGSEILVDYSRIESVQEIRPGGIPIKITTYGGSRFEVSLTLAEFIDRVHNAAGRIPPDEEE